MFYKNRKHKLSRIFLSTVLSTGLAVCNVALPELGPVHAITYDKFVVPAHANHWGRSDIRAYLNNGLGTIADDTESETYNVLYNGKYVSDKNYKIDSSSCSDNRSGYAKQFSDDEYDLIEPTEIETNVLDLNSKSISKYTTKDKIFLPGGNYSNYYVTSWGTKDISANSDYTSEIKNKENASRVIPISYWSTGSNACNWLRSPSFRTAYSSLMSYRGHNVHDLIVYIAHPCVAAALKINLSTVIFASRTSAAKLCSEGNSKIFSIDGSNDFGKNSSNGLPSYGMYLKTAYGDNSFNVRSMTFSGSSLQVDYEGGVIGKCVTLVAYKDDDITNGTSALAAAGRINNTSGNVTIDVTNWGAINKSDYTFQVWMEDGVNENLSVATEPKTFETDGENFVEKATATRTNKRVFALKEDLQTSWGNIAELSETEYSNLIKGSTDKLYGVNPTNQKIYYGDTEFWIAGREDKNGRIDCSGDIMCLYQACSSDQKVFNYSTSDYSDSNLSFYDLPTDLVGYVGDKLSTVSLPAAENGVWTWENCETVMSSLGVQTFNATFTPTDNVTTPIVYGIELNVRVIQPRELTFGKKKDVNGVTYYVTEHGKTSAEVTGNEIIWLREEHAKKNAWYGFDNSTGILTKGSWVWVQKFSEDFDKDVWIKEFEKLDDYHKKLVTSEKLCIIKFGVTKQDGEEEKDFEKNLTIYFQLISDLELKDLIPVFIRGSVDDPITVKFPITMNYPEGVDRFAKLTLT